MIADIGRDTSFSMHIHCMELVPVWFLKSFAK